MNETYSVHLILTFYFNWKQDFSSLNILNHCVMLNTHNQETSPSYPRGKCIYMDNIQKLADLLDYNIVFPYTANIMDHTSNNAYN